MKVSMRRTEFVPLTTFDELTEEDIAVFVE